MSRTVKLLTIGLLALPLLAGAQAEFGGTTRLLGAATGIVDTLITLVFSIGLLVFFWGIVKYISAAGDATKAKEGKSIMTYGVIAMFVMASIWGIVRFIGGELNIPVDTGGGGKNCPPLTSCE